MTIACVFTSAAGALMAEPDGSARRRLSSRPSWETSCCARPLLTLFAAILLAGCGILDADKLRPGVAKPVSPERIVVFGKAKVEVRLDVGRVLTGDGLLRLVPSSDAGAFREWQEKWWWLALDEDFYVVLPKQDYEFRSVSYWSHREVWPRFTTSRRIDCSGIVGFHVPPDASAVYVGTLDFKGEKKVSYASDSVTLVVKDEFDQAVRRLRERNPGFNGSIVKRLFRFQDQVGVTRHSPTSDATMSCESRTPSQGFYIPII